MSHESLGQHPTLSTLCPCLVELGCHIKVEHSTWENSNIKTNGSVTDKSQNKRPEREALGDFMILPWYSYCVLTFPIMAK
jgi:hypothetical protein